MKNRILIIISIILLTAFVLGSESKIYIGDEDGQLIVGLDSKTNSVDGGAGLEIRTYFRKEGIVVDGREYGAMLPKIKYVFMMAGTNKEGSILRFSREWSYLKDYEGEDLIAVGAKNCIATGYGKGNYLLFH